MNDVRWHPYVNFFHGNKSENLEKNREGILSLNQKLFSEFIWYLPYDLSSIYWLLVTFY